MTVHTICATDLASLRGGAKSKPSEVGEPNAALNLASSVLRVGGCECVYSVCVYSVCVGGGVGMCMRVSLLLDLTKAEKCVLCVCGRGGSACKCRCCWI